ncbi:hypothetical protein DEO72_LG11g1276 [Vigna unguiculata]|uniref:Uncharacterized protein n=1 Tax=Vigna unguiculata TaxID=3917 RepID=A0A4D6NR59_VIGUN|nr:hypothetical protein DEO72_LG11g1276 [Vigna unguiculata]
MKGLPDLKVNQLRWIMKREHPDENCSLDGGLALVILSAAFTNPFCGKYKWEKKGWGELLMASSPSSPKIKE